MTASYNDGWWDFPNNNNPFEDGSEEHSEYEAGFHDASVDSEK